MTGFDHDNTGKINLDGIYDQRDPSRYFSTLQKLDYRIPEEARPYFSSLLEARRAATGRTDAKVVDIGCSYGINAALLKHGLTMEDLYGLYGGEQESRKAMLSRDNAVFADPADGALEMVGLDIASNAVGYAVEAGALDAGLAANFEARDPSAREAAVLADPDLIISTGCFGYVTEASLLRLLDAGNGSRPWMAHFVLRMFPFDEAEAAFAERGYVTEKLEGLFPQRRFASMDEKNRVIANLDALGIDPSGAEADGWYFAELHVARPREAAGSESAMSLFEGLPRPMHH